MKRDRSAAAFSAARKIFPGGVNSPVRAFGAVGGEPFFIDRAEGPYLYDLDGNRYVDYINSWGPLVLGHAASAVIESVREQAARGTSYGAPSQLETELADLIISQMPNIEMLRFVNSGTEAGMSVIRLARAFTKRKKIVKFAGCYHGHADPLLVSAGSGAATFSVPDSAGVTDETAADTLIAEFNDPESIERLFAANRGQIAAVITEPIIGNSGLIKPKSDFLHWLRKTCDRENALLIFDEVMTGFRVAPGGAQSLYRVRPDLTMLGKVIGGGLPVGAFGGSAEIMSLLAPIGPVYQAGTLSGNPLAMAAGIATLKEWLKPGVFEETEKCGAQLCTALREFGSRSGVPLSVDQAGTMFGFFFQEGPVYSLVEAKRSDLAIFRRFFQHMLAHGVYFAPSQFEAGFISHAHKGEALQHTIDALSAKF